jgi:hypothetical protein
MRFCNWSGSSLFFEVKILDTCSQTCQISHNSIVMDLWDYCSTIGMYPHWVGEVSSSGNDGACGVSNIGKSTII